MSTEDEVEVENDDINTIAMTIILKAGNARAEVRQAYEALAAGNQDRAAQHLIDARNEIAQAHRAQTKLIQSEARGVQHTMTLLFSHAQDTLMTINSEVITANNLAAVIDSFDQRITALEKSQGK